MADPETMDPATADPAPADPAPAPTNEATTDPAPADPAPVDPEVAKAAEAAAKTTAERREAIDRMMAMCKHDKGEPTRLYVCMRLHEATEIAKKSKNEEDGCAARELLIQAYRMVFELLEMMLCFVVNAIDDPDYKRQIKWPSNEMRVSTMSMLYPKAITDDLKLLLLSFFKLPYYQLARCTADIPQNMGMFISLPDELDEFLPLLVAHAEKMLPFTRCVLGGLGASGAGSMQSIAAEGGRPHESGSARTPA